MASFKGAMGNSAAAVSELIGKTSQHVNLSAIYSHSSNTLMTVAQMAPESAAAYPLATMALVLGVGMVVAPGLITVPVLNAAGFSANGVVAGSAATAVQGAIGNVVAGSPFAVAQSAAAGGYGLTAVNGVVQVAGMGIGAAGAARRWSKL